ncbi:hypothetical protein Lal_00040863 [Lupinus albus]|nr:hypothetical protein Lal_00040863 [Lupinus albus]
MVGGDNTKKLKVEENSEDIDPQLLLSIQKLQEIQDNLEKINEEASDKVVEIEQKYNEIRKPVYDNRNEIIKSIPDFWLTAFLSHPALGELLNDEDQKIFKYLDSLEVEDHKDVKSGYTITLNFKPNPYFEDTKLTKTYTFHDEGATKITATPIKWKEGKGIPNGVDHEKKGNKRAFVDIRPISCYSRPNPGKLSYRCSCIVAYVPKSISYELQSSLYVHHEPCVLCLPSNSFFSWFSDCEEKDDDMDDILDEVAELIKDDLWPNPLTYFNNEVPDDIETIGGPYEENDDDEDDSEDDDDDEEEE